ncbi:hypothetical protein IWQ60_004901 [Tieghemiomyces parasiticus]|uniref:Uncharacterized protein n=1 Tax=Tieghemiomyces parasiticus TaxID=78921 RepID=A0A9W8AF28_9FUNG|nr:hypothetical protein IWQ60_004901 [Tieghemiomyces parasiticus]
MVAADAFYTEFEKQLERCKLVQDDFRKTQLDLQQRLVELAELQNALQKNQETLMAEKQRTFELAKENDQLKVRELEDRKKIRYLLSLAQSKPVRRTERPEETTSSDTCKRARLETGADVNGGHTRKRPVPVAGDEGIDIHTLQITNQGLQLKVNALETQLVEQKAYYERLNTTLANQSTLLTQQETLRARRDAQALALSGEKYHQIHRFYTDNLKELLHLRQEKEKVETEHHQAARALEAECKTLRSRMVHAEGELRSTQKLTPLTALSRDFVLCHIIQSDQTVERKVSAHFEATIIDLQRRLELASQELLSTKREETRNQTRYTQKIDSLNQQVERTKTSFQAYRTRMYLELEGLITDCASLLRRLVSHQQTVLRLDIPNESASVLLRSAEDHSSRIDKLVQDLGRLKQRCLDQR